MVLTKSNIDRYLNEHKNAWTEKTRKNKQAALGRMLSICGGTTSPEKIFGALQSHYSPYSLKINWSLLSSYYDWLLETKRKQGQNPFVTFKKRNAKFFRNVYDRKKVSLTFEQAEQRIETLENEDYVRAARQLLYGGLRISELYSVSDDRVTGKFSKQRAYYGQEYEAPKVTENQLRYQLSKIGLKPHDLRKLFATRLSEFGMRPEDICEVTGWKSFSTAQKYMQPTKEDKLRQKVQEAMKCL